MTVQLYFVRHAIAVEHGTEGYSDDERPLTAEGREKMHAGARGIRNLKIFPELILSSPLPRAFQTAEILQAELSKKNEAKPALECDSELAPGGDWEDFLARLKKRKETEVMLVGHEPAMSSWVQHLLGFDPPGSIRLKKGSLCHLELRWIGTRPVAELIALLQPRMLRQID